MIKLEYKPNDEESIEGNPILGGIEIQWGPKEVFFGRSITSKIGGTHLKSRGGTPGKVGANLKFNQILEITLQHRRESMEI